MGIKSDFPYVLTTLIFLLVFFPAGGRAQVSDTPGRNQWDQYLPPGGGKEHVKGLCTSCHDLGRIVTRRADRIAWQRTINSFLPRDYIEYLGDDMDILTKYLAEYFGPLIPTYETLLNDAELRQKYLSGQIKSLININVAPVVELTRLPGIDEVTAEMIVKYRQTHGAFKSSEDLKAVQGVDDKRFEDLKVLITIE